MYSSRIDAFSDFSLFETFWKDEDLIYCRVQRRLPACDGPEYVAVIPSAERPSSETLDRLAHEYELRNSLQSNWAVRPLEIMWKAGQGMLLLERPAGTPLEDQVSRAMDLEAFLEVAAAMATAVRRMHEAGLVHRDLRPSRFWWDDATRHIRLTGFGSASPLSSTFELQYTRNVSAGAWPYMAPEQTGRTNHPIDSRSDFYSLGVTLYQLLTGRLPFVASDPIEWVHCHLARLPAPPQEIRPGVPQPLSAIIMKLLSKTPDTRYQTAIGLEKDLLECLSRWRKERLIDRFEIGASDIGDRLLKPRKLHGRIDELSKLLRARARVKDTGQTELVLISGYAGAGKSALVNELLKAEPDGLFAAGKFDQYKRDIPYATIAQACQYLVGQVLNKPETEVALWRHALKEALGNNGELLTNLVPQLTLVIGEQPAVSRIEPQDAKARFHHTFERFVTVFARPEHPLTLFIDDLHWLDVATLELLRFLSTQSRLKHLLLIAAYRDSEITGSHVLNQTIEAIRRGGAPISEINLGPLPMDQVVQLTSDALRADEACVRPLATLLYEKTGGNPFFAIQFIGELAQEGLVTIDPERLRWNWNLDRIRSKNITDNVADLVAAKISRLPIRTRAVVGQIACVGNTVDWRTILAVRHSSEEDLERSLRKAIQAGLLVRSGDSVSFTHDRVHEAAYGTIRIPERPMVHLRIARTMLSSTDPAELNDHIFEIVDQFNRGISEIESVEERLQVAELNLIAGKRARAASAYASALRYFDVGRELLPEDQWQRCYRLSFDLECYSAECLFVLGNLAAAEGRLSALKTRAATLNDESEVTRLLLLVYFNAGKQELAIQTGFAFLEKIGNLLPQNPDDDDVRVEYEKMCANLGGRSIDELRALPQMRLADHLATMEVLTELYPAASTSEHRSRALADLIILRMTNMSLQHGHCDASSVAYSGLSLFLAPRFGDYFTAYRFSQLACELADKHGTPRSKARAYAQTASFALPWFDSLQKCQSLLKQAFEELRALGDTTFAAYTLRNLGTNLLASGADLQTVMQQAEQALAFALSAGLQSIAEPFVAHRRVVAALRDIELDDKPPSDDWARQTIGEQRGVGKMASYHWVFQLQQSFFSGDYGRAVEAARYVEPIRWALQAGVEEAIYEFYSALAHAAMCDARSVGIEALIQEVRTHAERIARWADQCPDNFAHSRALVFAELARVEGQDVKAQRLYEEAIELSRHNGFLQDEALSYELAAGFYRARGFERIAKGYILEARACYVRWGAFAKVRQLDGLYPQIGADIHSNGKPAGVGEAIEHLDLATVLKVSQAVSGEIEPDNVITTLMRLALEHAGAERGLLILPHEGGFAIRAEAITKTNGVCVQLQHIGVSSQHLPETVFNYVVRTKDNLLLHDASVESAFSSDNYIQRTHAHSLLCMPLLNQARLLGILYLENNLAPSVFTPARISILKLLASTAAISLENTTLYSNLKEREARVRRLVESNIIGIFLWDAEGRIIEANDAFLRIIGYSRRDFGSGYVRWKDLTPAEWEEIDQQQLAKLQESGAAPPYEKEFFRKDGSRAPVLIGAAVFDRIPTEGVAFVLDLTERNNAERLYHESQLQLIHANRVTTISHLSASMAHELNQPLAGIITNANTCLAMLAAHVPNVAGASETARRTIRDAKRASDVINRVRSLFSKNDARSELLDLSDVAQEVLEICSAEFRRAEVVVHPFLARNLPLILGDRVQLQQVTLNLLQNALDSMSGLRDGPKRLTIRTKVDAAEYVVLSVEDSGIGFDTQFANRLFDAFYTTKHQGMGIGLSVSRSIVESHSGRIWAANNDGPGATVSFSIPSQSQG